MTPFTYQGSILEVKADAIVNPANCFLQHGGGLAKVIDECARGSNLNGTVREDWPNETSLYEYNNEFMPAVEAYYKFKPGLVATGTAVIGPPGALCRRYKAIIHAVGPIWAGGHRCERELLRGAVSDALSCAEDSGFESIVFPAISAGIFGVPIDVVAEVMVRTCTCTDLQVYIALTDPEHLAAFKRARLG